MLGSEFKAPAGPYKLKMKNAVPWRDFDQVRVRVSVGKAISESDKFYAFMEWAGQRFERVTVVVGDTLQRHNIAFEEDLSPTAAERFARAAGDAWLVRNREALKLVQGVKIVRWDELLADPRHAAALQVLRSLYADAPDFRSAIDGTIEAFWQRNGGRIGTMRRSQFGETSRAFLLEELAAFSYQCAEPAVDAYAGSWLDEIFAALRSQSSSFFDGFRRDWLQVDFTRNKSFAGLASVQRAA